MTSTWNASLISQVEALELAGAEPVAWIAAEGGLVLRHQSCGSSCGVWTAGIATSADDILAGVLRHLVTAHDLPLNRAARERRAEDERSGDSTAGNGQYARTSPEPGPGNDASGADTGLGPGGAAPGETSGRLRGAAGETGGDRA